MKNFHDLSNFNDRKNISKSYLYIDKGYEFEENQNEYERLYSLSYFELDKNKQRTNMRAMIWNEDINKIIEKTNNFYLRFPINIDKSKKRILILIEDCDIRKYKSIHDFIMNSSKFINNNNYMIDILVDKPNYSTFDDSILIDNISIHFPYKSCDDVLFYDFSIPKDSHIYSEKVASELFIEGIEEYINEYGKPYLVISNSYSSCIAISKLNELNRLSIIHIDDIMNEDKSIIDFSNNKISAYIDLLESLNHKICTQSYLIKTRIEDIIEKEVEILHEPYSISCGMMNIENEKRGILLIDNNNTIEELNLSMSSVSPIGLPITIITNKDFETIEEIKKNNKLNKCNILYNLNKKYYKSIINSHKMILGLSFNNYDDILELSANTPILMCDSKKELYENKYENIKFTNVSNKIDIIKNIIVIYGNPFLENTLDLNDYKTRYEESWNKLIFNK